MDWPNDGSCFNSHALRSANFVLGNNYHRLQEMYEFVSQGTAGEV